MADGMRRSGGTSGGRDDSSRLRREISGLGDIAGKRVHDEIEDAISSAMRDGFARGAAPAGSFANSFKSQMARALSEVVVSTFTGKKAGAGGASGGGGGLLGGLFGGGAGKFLGYAGLALDLFSAFNNRGERAPIAAPESPAAGGGGEFGGTRPLYGSRRMQLAQFSSRNISGALQRMAAEGQGVSVEVTLNDRGNFQKEVVRATVKQTGRERRRGLRRHEY